MKILVIQTASIGDVILSTSLLEALHKEFPDAYIDILVKKGVEELFLNHPFLNNVILWNKSNRKYLNLLKIIKKVRKEKYDHVITLQRFFTSGLITVLSKGGSTAGFKKNPLSFLFKNKIDHIIGDEDVHEVDRNLELVSYLGIKKRAPVKLYPSGNDYKKVNELIGHHPCVCIAPASLWKTKQMPEEKWIDLINSIPENYHIFLLGSKSDLGICVRICNQTSHTNVNIVAGDLTLLETAAIMKKSLMNYTNDSAPMHIASAVNSPVTAIYCSTVPEFGFSPLSENSYIVECETELFCRPCGLHGKKNCPEKHFKCGYDIRVSQLLKPLQQ